MVQRMIGIGLVLLASACLSDYSGPDPATNNSDGPFEYGGVDPGPILTFNPIPEIPEYRRRANERTAACQKALAPFGFDFPFPASTAPDCNDPNDRCEAVPVTVTYHRTEDLGLQNSAVIEAFDNPLFIGLPRRVKVIPGFSASKPGDRKATVMHVKPGEYYLRSYLINDTTTPLPYEIQGMELIGEAPSGFLGAISTPTPILVGRTEMGDCQPPQEIFLTRLLKDPNAPRETQAHIRILMTMPNIEQNPIPEYRKLMVELFSDPDFQKVPIERYEMSTLEFLVTGHVGKADFVTPALEEGVYFLRVYLDANGNGFWDEGERLAIEGGAENPRMVKAIKNRTENRVLDLN